MRNKVISEFVIILGLSFWLSIAVFNNIIDINTNIINIQKMITMVLLKDNELANGLIHRALEAEWATLIMYFVIFIQLIICSSLWRASFHYFLVFVGKGKIVTAKKTAITALTFFNMLWFFFLCGGLWFGYWMKQGAIQNVHMTLLIIGIATSIYITMTDKFESPDDLA